MKRQIARMKTTKKIEIPSIQNHMSPRLTMFPTISATRIQRWWKSLTPCNGCGILIPCDEYNFNRCEICYHERHEDSCKTCESGLTHSWNEHLLAKHKKYISLTYIPQMSDEE